jgi:hypothetical protein
MKQFIQEGRITSRHGRILPPRKKAVVSRYITHCYVIDGIIPSKKNMIWADSNLPFILKRLYSFKAVKECVDWLRENLKPFIRNSKKYQDWLEIQKPLLMEQHIREVERYGKFGLSYPLENVSVKVYHYWKDNVERDNSNKYDTIIDLMVSCKIISNDCWQVVCKNESESESYHGQILDHITTIDVTARIF